MAEPHIDGWAVMRNHYLPSNDPLKKKVFRRVERLLAVPHGHGPLFRVVWVAAGIILVLAGLVMMVFPGPALVVLPMGLAMLAGTFPWARTAVKTSIDRGVDMQRWLAGLDVRVKVVAASAAACLAAAVAAAFLL